MNALPRIEWPLHIVRRVAIGLVVVAVLAVAVPYGWSWFRDWQARCDDGVVERGETNECVGVTDGAYPFADHLEEVEDKIKKENDAVKKSKEKYVSVAYLTPFTLTEDDSNSEESVRHELQGAYLAQQRHNNGDLSASPKIRLLIANTGSKSRQWRHTVDELIKRKNTDDHLVAVAGMGPSNTENVKAINRLSKHGIAMVGATMSATNIRGIKGFVRVAPTNEDEARAAAAYLKTKNARTAVVVQDQAEDNLYAKTLGAAFTEAFPDPDGKTRKLVAEEPMTFDSSVPNAWKNELLYMRAQLCIQKPQYVYFAGRGQHLTHFLSAIANRPCPNTKFTVITGDDTTNLTAHEITLAAKSGVAVFYTGLAHPRMWEEAPEAVSILSARYFKTDGELHEWFPNDQRNDGQAMMAHDAVITAAQGIQMAARWQGKVTGDAVARMFHQMGPGQQVAGASGFISFHENGNPVNKVVPILTLNEKGQAEFVEPSFANGKPPKGD